MTDHPIGSPCYPHPGNGVYYLPRHLPECWSDYCRGCVPCPTHEGASSAT